MQDLVAILLHDLGYYEYYVLFGTSNKQLKFTGQLMLYLVLTTTSSTVRINDNSKTNSPKKPSSSSRGRKFPVYSILYIEKCCYPSLGMIGILRGYYIRFELLGYDPLTR